MKARQAASGGGLPGVWTPLLSGERRRPARSYLHDVEHGNPVARRATGGLTVRKADGCGGNRMVQEANAGRSKGNGKRATDGRSSSGRRAITARIPALWSDAKAS